MNWLINMLISWFNDGKRLTVLAIQVVQLLVPWLRAHGVEVPEELVQPLAATLVSIVLLALSKKDVRIPAPVTTS